MFDDIADRYEFVNRIMTLGMDVAWRRRCVRDLRLPTQSRVLDVAAGTGDFYRALQRAELKPVATDLSVGMLRAAHGVTHVVQANASSLPFASDSFDGVTCGYALRNFTELKAAIYEMGRVVRSGGRVCVLEVAEPHHRLWRWGFRLWFRRFVPFIGGVLSNRSAYRYLPASTAYLPERTELLDLFREAGFGTVNHRLILGGLSQVILATKTHS